MSDALDLQRATIERRLHGSANRIKWAAGDEQRILQRLSGAELGQVAAPVAATGARSFTFTISTAKVDSYGDSISVAGWDLKAFEANPVVLWGHDSGLIPVGKATRTWVAGAKLKSTVELAPADANPMAEQLRQLLLGGFVRMSSVGFMPTEWTFSSDKKRPLGIDFTKSVLMEWSIVNIPANTDCCLDPGQIETASRSADRVETEAEREARHRAARMLAVSRA